MKNEKAWQVGKLQVVQYDWIGVEGGKGREGQWVEEREIKLVEWTEGYREGLWF